MYAPMTTKTIGSRVNGEVHTLFTDVCNDEGRVSFDKIDIDLDNEFTIKERLTEEHTPKKKENKNNNPQKIDAQKINPNAYESWTISDEEFFKNYWNDESNKLSEYEKIKELSQKTGRSKGAIVSKLEKMGLD